MDRPRHEILNRFSMNMEERFEALERDVSDIFAMLEKLSVFFQPPPEAVTDLNGKLNQDTP